MTAFGAHPPQPQPFPGFAAFPGMMMMIQPPMSPGGVPAQGPGLGPGQPGMPVHFGPFGSVMHGAQGLGDATPTH